MEFKERLRKLVNEAKKIVVVGCWISKSKWDYNTWRRFRVYVLTPEYEFVELKKRWFSIGYKTDFWEVNVMGTNRVYEIVYEIARMLNLDPYELENKTVFLSNMCTK